MNITGLRSLIAQVECMKNGVALRPAKRSGYKSGTVGTCDR